MRFEGLTEEEAQACFELVEKMREEKARQEEIQDIKNIFNFDINYSIHHIGLEETKRIVRKINRRLRLAGVTEE